MQPILGKASGDRFGSSVSMSVDGKIIVVGAPGTVMMERMALLLMLVIFASTVTMQF